MTTLVMLSADADLSELAALLRAQAPDLAVYMQGEPGAERAEVAVCWNPPAGALGALKQLKLVQSIAAGVDHIYADPSLPNVPVCRAVDPELKQGMAQYVLWGVLHYFRGMDQALAQQRTQQWQPPPQQAAGCWQVGVMGLGELGAHVATLLASLGFSVRGWARSGKTLPGVTVHSGALGLPGFLQGLDCLVCLLPLTARTRCVLNARTFGQLKPGAVLINCARGAHLVVPDLLAALASGQLRGALLDVFEHEPLPAEHVLWRTPGVVVTPHMASSAADAAVAQQVLANVRRLREGLPLVHQVRAGDGY